MAVYKVSIFDCEPSPPALIWSADVTASAEAELAPAVLRVLADARHETRNPLLNYSLNVRSPRPPGRAHW